MRSVLIGTLIAAASAAQSKPVEQLNDEVVDMCKDKFGVALAELEFPTKALNNLTIDVCLK